MKSDILPALRETQSIDKPKAFSRKDLLAVVVMPLVVVGLTAGAGSWIAASLQERAFRNNELFRARLSRVIAAESEARALRRDVEDAIRVIKAREEFMRGEVAKADDADVADLSSFYREELVNSSSVATIRRSVIDLKALADDTVGAGQMLSVTKLTASYAQQANQLEQCLKEKGEFSDICATKHAQIVDEIRSIVVAHGKRADAIIQAREAQ